MKCYPCLRCLAAGKSLVGLALIGVGAWMARIDDATIMQCGDITETCPPAFEQLMAELHSSSVFAHGQNEIQAYCDCVTSCLNYYLVYEEDLGNPDPSNCFLLSAQLVPPDRRLSPGHGNSGQPPAAAMFRSALGGASPAWDQSASLPGAARGLLEGESPAMEDENSCMDCQEVAETTTRKNLVRISIVAGIAALLSASCELFEFKWRGEAYAYCVLLTDLAVASVLAMSCMLASLGVRVSGALCETSTMNEIFEKAGEDSTNGGPGDAAAFAEFIRTLMEPSMEGLCALHPKFLVSTMTLLTGTLLISLSFLVTVCICTGATDAGNSGSPSDLQDPALQELMSSRNNARNTTANEGSS